MATVRPPACPDRAPTDRCTPVVMIPDLFDGDSVTLNKPNDFDVTAWRDGRYHPKGTAHLPANVDPIVEASLAEMRESYRCKVKSILATSTFFVISYWPTNLMVENRRCGILLWCEVCHTPSTPKPQQDRCWIQCASKLCDRG